LVSISELSKTTFFQKTKLIYIIRGIIVNILNQFEDIFYGQGKESQYSNVIQKVTATTLLVHHDHQIIMYLYKTLDGCQDVNSCPVISQ